MFLAYVYEMLMLMKFCLEMDHQREVIFKLYFKVHFFLQMLPWSEAFNMAHEHHIRSTVSPSIVMHGCFLELSPFISTCE